MDQRSNLIWTFLIILTVVVVLWEVYNTYAIANRVSFYRREAAQTILGSDEQLSQTVNQLETTLAERHDYAVELDKDPLNLGEVIRSQKVLNRLGFQEMQEDEEMRLSCTVVGENSNSAILKYGGRSQVVEVGDVVNGYKIIEISEKEMKLKRGGEVLVLKTQKATVPWETEGPAAGPTLETTPPISGSGSGNF
jgi:molybdopterin converting factor small subunit